MQSSTTNPMPKMIAGSGRTASKDDVVAVADDTAVVSILLSISVLITSIASDASLSSPNDIVVVGVVAHGNDDIDDDDEKKDLYMVDLGMAI